jgi:transcriptional regulator with AAA-type ATPase domain
MGSNRIATTPTSIEATGLTLGFLADLALKIIYRHGSLLGYQVADALKLPFTNVTEAVLDHLRREQLTEVKGSGTISEASYRHQITTKGRTQAREAMERSHYAGAAPVTLEDYAQVVRSQSVTDCLMTEDQLRQALSQLVLGEDLLDQLGPAVNSGRTMFLYGNTGNGKTSICQAIGQAMPGGIWIPCITT